MINRLFLIPTVLFLFFGLIIAAILTPFITDYQQLRELDIPKNDDLTVLSNIILQEKIINSPQTTDGIIYAQTLSEIVAIDQSKTEFVWRQKIDGDDSNCSFVIYEDMILVPSEYGVLFAINRGNGQILWSLPQKSYKEEFEDIKVGNGLVYTATYNGFLEVHNTENGELIRESLVPQRTRIKLEIIKDTLLMYASGKLYAFDANDGNQLWERSIEIGDYLYWREKELVILYEWRDGGYWITGIDINSGLDQWNTEIAISEVNCLTVVGDQLLVSGEGIARFDWDNKKTLWTNKTLDHLACPVILGNTILVKKMGRDLFFYDYSSGNLYSRYPLRWSIFNNKNRTKEPIIVDNQIVLSITGKDISSIGKK